MGEDIADFADGGDIALGRCRTIKDRVVGGRNGEVFTVAGAVKAFLFAADKGPRDDTTNLERIDMATHQTAEGIEIFEAECLFMRCDLQHAIGGGVEDRFAACDMVGAQCFDDRGTGRVTIPQDAW